MGIVEYGRKTSVWLSVESNTHAYAQIESVHKIYSKCALCLYLSMYRRKTVIGSIFSSVLQLTYFLCPLYTQIYRYGRSTVAMGIHLLTYAYYMYVRA